MYTNKNTTLRGLTENEYTEYNFRRQQIVVSINAAKEELDELYKDEFHVKNHMLMAKGEKFENLREQVAAINEQKREVCQKIKDRENKLKDLEQEIYELRQTPIEEVIGYDL